MRTFIFLAIIAVVGLPAWICLADGKETKGKETKGEETAEEETQPWISPEDSALFIEVFETYLDYDMDFANSSMKLVKLGDYDKWYWFFETLFFPTKVKK